MPRRADQVLMSFLTPASHAAARHGFRPRHGV